MEDFYGKNFKKSKKIFPGFYFNFFLGLKNIRLHNFSSTKIFSQFFFAGFLCLKRANRAPEASNRNHSLQYSLAADVVVVTSSVLIPKPCLAHTKMASKPI